MKTAIITYDLLNVKGDDNQNVKKALLNHSNTKAWFIGPNELSYMQEERFFVLPDTTIFVTVAGNITTDAIIDDVIRVIESVGATPDKVFAAFIAEHKLFNSRAVSATR